MDQFCSLSIKKNGSETLHAARPEIVARSGFAARAGAARVALVSFQNHKRSGCVQLFSNNFPRAVVPLLIVKYFKRCTAHRHLVKLLPRRILTPDLPPLAFRVVELVLLGAALERFRVVPALDEVDLVEQRKEVRLLPESNARNMFQLLKYISNKMKSIYFCVFLGYLYVKCFKTTNSYFQKPLKITTHTKRVKSGI